jgi:prohibitin 2
MQILLGGRKTIHYNESAGEKVDAKQKDPLSFLDNKIAFRYTFFMGIIEQTMKSGGAMTKNVGKYILVGLIIVFVLIFMFKIYIVVDPGEKAVIFNKATGNLRATPNEGFYFLIPLIEQPTVYDMKARTYTMSIATLEGEIKGDDSLQALTSDGQTVLLDISVRYHPDADKLINLHRRLGVDYVNKVLRPQVRSIVRMIVSEYPVLDIYSGKRLLIQAEIENKLRESFKKNYIICEEVLLRNVQFSQDFQQAIENKQIAQQEAQRMKYVLEKQELEKQRKIIEATGEAESLRLKGKALADNPLLIQYEYVKLLSPNIQAIITDQSSIFNFSEFLKGQKK